MGENRPGLIRLSIIIAVLLLIYTRFIGLSWGLPYPMHPDERNMAWAVQQLSCPKFSIFSASWRIQNLKECFNPHFFAYGQFPLYLAFILIKATQFLVGQLAQAIDFNQSIIALRTISAISSVLNVLVLLSIISLLRNKNQKMEEVIISFLLFIFVPYFIQLSHFGTTESLLMFFYSLIIYLCVLMFVNQSPKIKYIFFISLILGLSMATKISSLSFALLPMILLLKILIAKSKKSYLARIRQFIIHIFLLSILTLFFAVIFSPHNLISLNDFLGTFNYERDVAIGSAKVFYTRQFYYTIPILFQLQKIFPYVLGWPQYLLFFLGFVFLPWTDKKINFLRFAFLIYFLPSSFLYAKWTRFASPIFPLMSIFASMSFIQIYRYIIDKSAENVKFKEAILSFILFIAIIPGLAYLVIYLAPDVRFVASKSVYENMPGGSYILSETANVVDIPIMSKLTSKMKNIPSYTYISFNFYDLDGNRALQNELKDHINRADYIFIPSRRVFANHTCFKNVKSDDCKWAGQLSKVRCLNQVSGYGLENSKCSNLVMKYSHVWGYYAELLEKSKKFRQIAEFTSYPRIELFGKKIIEFPDEDAEETWTVFDHPVFRIYKKT